MSWETTPRWGKSLVTFVAGATIGALSVAQIIPDAAGGPRVTGDTSATVLRSEAETATSGAAGTGAGGADGVGGDTTVTAGLACAAGRNGGRTDTGVSATSLKLGTTVVQSGIGASFLGDVQFAMEAVRNKVNRGGGVCGRLIDIRYVDDGWDASRGAQFLRNFMKDDVFAVPVGPSSEGLRVVIDSGDVRRTGIPVVGTDGMIINQYTDPWVWPVAVATASSARIMARNAHERGAREFSIVFDKNYRFGVEAAEAYNAEVRRLTGSPVQGYNSSHNCQDAFCGILAGQSSYATEVNEFAPHKGDFVAMFLEPATALTWMATSNVPTPDDVPKGVGAAQPLFTRDFAVNCQSKCDGMWVWTGYKPPIEEYADDAPVKGFVSDLEKTKPDADEFNAFAMGGYVGMLLLVHGLRQVGPELTRARLRDALDQTQLSTGLTLQPVLRWSRGHHFANATMRAFDIQYKGTFGGWRAQAIERDPTPENGVG